MDESRNQFAKLIENADTIPLEELRKEALEYFRQTIYAKPSDLYADSGTHRDISLYTAAVQLLYFMSLNAAVAFSIYITRSEEESPKTKTTKKAELLSLEAKKAIAEQVKKEIRKYKRKTQVITS